MIDRTEGAGDFLSEVMIMGLNGLDEPFSLGALSKFLKVRCETHLVFLFESSFPHDKTYLGSFSFPPHRFS